MTHIDFKQEREEKLKEFNALKTLFGGLLLESNGAAKSEDIAYFQRKFKEAQQCLRK